MQGEARHFFTVAECARVCMPRYYDAVRSCAKGCLGDLPEQVAVHECQHQWHLLQAIPPCTQHPAPCTLNPNPTPKPRAPLQVIKALREREIPVVIDADGLFIVTRNLELVRGNPRCVLTPNKAEFARLAAALDVDLESGARRAPARILGNCRLRCAVCGHRHCRAAANRAMPPAPALYLTQKLLQAALPGLQTPLRSAAARPEEKAVSPRARWWST